MTGRCPAESEFPVHVQLETPGFFIADRSVIRIIRIERIHQKDGTVQGHVIRKPIAQLDDTAPPSRTAVSGASEIIVVEGPDHGVRADPFVGIARFQVALLLDLANLHAKRPGVRPTL